MTPHFLAATFTVFLFFSQESSLKCRKDLRKALHLDHQRWKRKHVVSFREHAYLWDKIIRVTPNARGVQETLKCGLGKKEMKNPDGILFSVPRETERKVQKILQKRMPRETESTRERLKVNSDTMNAFRKYRSSVRRCIFRYGRDLWFHRCRQHCAWTRVTKRKWNYCKILNLRTSKVCSEFRDWSLKGIQKLRIYFPQTLRVHSGKNMYCLKSKQ